MSLQQLRSLFAPLQPLTPENCIVKTYGKKVNEITPTEAVWMPERPSKLNPYFPVEFQFKVLEGDRVECINCKKLAFGLKVLKCGCLLCFTCSQNLKDVCTAHKLPVEFLENPPNETVATLSTCIVECPFKQYGCGEKIPLLTLYAHVERCTYCQVQCPYCLDVVKAKTIESHLENCRLAVFRCKVCGLGLDRSDKAIHVQTQHPRCGYCGELCLTPDDEYHQPRVCPIQGCSRVVPLCIQDAHFRCPELAKLHLSMLVDDILLQRQMLVQGQLRISQNQAKLQELLQQQKNLEEIELDFVRRHKEQQMSQLFEMQKDCSLEEVMTIIDEKRMLQLIDMLIQSTQVIKKQTAKEILGLITPGFLRFDGQFHPSVVYCSNDELTAQLQAYPYLQKLQESMSGLSPKQLGLLSVALLVEYMIGKAQWLERDDVRQILLQLCGQVTTEVRPGQKNADAFYDAILLEYQLIFDDYLSDKGAHLLPFYAGIGALGDRQIDRVRLSNDSLLSFVETLHLPVIKANVEDANILLYKYKLCEELVQSYDLVFHSPYQPTSQLAIRVLFRLIARGVPKQAKIAILYPTQNIDQLTDFVSRGAATLYIGLRGNCCPSFQIIQKAGPELAVLHLVNDMFSRDSFLSIDDFTRALRHCPNIKDLTLANCNFDTCTVRDAVPSQLERLVVRQCEVDLRFFLQLEMSELKHLQLELFIPSSKKKISQQYVRQLFIKLRQLKHLQTLIVDLNNELELDPDAISALAASLRQIKVKQLTVHHAGLCHESLNLLFANIDGMTTVDLSYNPLFGMQLIASTTKTLAMFFSTNWSVETLILQQTMLSSTSITALANTIESLEIDHTERHNKALKFLVITDNFLQNEDAEPLGRVLKRLVALECVDIRGNVSLDSVSLQHLKGCMPHGCRVLFDPRLGDDLAWAGLERISPGEVLIE